MANISNLYNPEAEAQADLSAIPTGEYLAVIVDSDMKPTKKNDGQFLELVHEIMDGEFKGRKVWANLNLDNPSVKAVEIANRQLASIREATGVMNPTDSQQLHYKPMVIRVEFIPAGTTQNNGYVTTRDGNEIKAWKKAEGAAATASAPAQQSAPAAGTTTPPWQRSAA
jgi:hypothetical protein